MINVPNVRRRIVSELAEWGWIPRDADGTDFAHPDNRNGLRFKIGTSYGEVAVTVWMGSQQMLAVRTIRDDQASGTIDVLRDLIKEQRA